MTNNRSAYTQPLNNKHLLSTPLALNEKRQYLLALLDEIKALMIKQGYWQLERPSDQALASQAPFAVDTLSFPQWLQFIFLDRFKEIILSQQPLPTSMSIAPVACETLPSELALFELLTQIDLLVSE